mgnify:CR=1 FL=1
MIGSGSVKSASRCHSEPFFGDESLFSDKTRTYRAVAEETTTLLTLSKTNLFTMISECPSIGVGFLQVYALKDRFFS